MAETPKEDYFREVVVALGGKLSSEDSVATQQVVSMLRRLALVTTTDS
ncbi:hypothetical protein ACU4GD_33955 [Cupriavidus basilensis]